jgi:hypothetical protein
MLGINLTAEKALIRMGENTQFFASVLELKKLTEIET